MADRPLSITLICVAIGLFTLSAVLRAVAAIRAAGGLDAGTLPLVWLGLGLLGVYAALALWVGSRRGRVAALAWAALWGLLELGLVVLTVAGVMRPGAAAVPTEALLRVVVAAIVFHYVLTVGGPYVRGAPDDDAGPSSASEV